MSTSSQLVIIHTLRKVLALSEEVYRDMLKDNFNVSSSKELSVDQAATLIRSLKAHVDGPPGQPPTKKWDHLTGRPGMASPAQLRLVEAMWKDVSRVKESAPRSEALRAFLEKRFHVKALLWLEASQVQKVIRALKAMKSSASGKAVTA